MEVFLKRFSHKQNKVVTLLRHQLVNNFFFFFWMSTFPKQINFLTGSSKNKPFKCSDFYLILFFILFYFKSDDIHVITITDDSNAEKPPNYDQVITNPPSYQEAIKLNPSILLNYSSNTTVTGNANSSIETVASSSTTPIIIISKLKSFGNQNQLPEVHQSNEKSEIQRKSDDSPDRPSG
jgi:hypothetical protein